MYGSIEDRAMQMIEEIEFEIDDFRQVLIRGDLMSEQEIHYFVVRLRSYKNDLARIREEIGLPQLEPAS